MKSLCLTPPAMGREMGQRDSNPCPLPHLIFIPSSISLNTLRIAVTPLFSYIPDMLSITETTHFFMSRYTQNT
jgi:hypothetical protein